METVRTKTSASARTRSVAFVGLAIAIIAVSAWVTVPLGPIPFTLQMFAVTFAVVVLSPKEAIASIAGYLLLGAVGVPVFSGMRGGIGVLAVLLLILYIFSVPIFICACINVLTLCIFVHHVHVRCLWRQRSVSDPLALE